MALIVGGCWSWNLVGVGHCHPLPRSLVFVLQSWNNRFCGSLGIRTVVSGGGWQYNPRALCDPPYSEVVLETIGPHNLVSSVEIDGS